MRPIAEPATRKYTELDRSVLKTLLYFDVFRYPLKSSEVYSFLGVNSITEKDVEKSLQQLSSENVIAVLDEFYSIENNVALADRRRAGNERARQSFPIALKQAALISKFPFVRGVFASGSLSKNYMDEASDIDFFIVTAPQRVFITRTLLVLYKRIFLANSHKYFCVNYFIDDTALEIEEKNQFTATELSTILPLYNVNIYHKLIAANQWLKAFFPNFRHRDTTAVLPERERKSKKLAEFVLSFVAGPLEAFSRWLTLQRWKRIYARQYSKDDFEIAFKTNKHVSKGHPNIYQRKVIDSFENKMRTFSNAHNINLLQ